jgi:predicted nucleic acid-binding protein
MSADGLERWVINASPLICLGKIDHLDWLHELATEIVIPRGVAAEIELARLTIPHVIG